MDTLTDKQRAVFYLAQEVFGEKLEEKIEAVLSTLKNTADIDYIEYDKDRTKELLNDIIYDNTLGKQFIFPPFSVFDTRSGEWLRRRRLIDDYTGSSAIGRENNLTFSSSLPKVREDDTGTSRFDSVLTELILKWFGFKNAVVYDCFSGGHIRGVMASLLGYKYIGIDLSAEQLEANKKVAEKLGLKDIEWWADDSLNANRYIKDNTADLFFSCPPYGDLEKYTDDPRDLSNMDYDEFKKNYDKIIQIGVNKLKDNRFAVFVVGDFRDEKGYYRGFIVDTINAFKKAGMGLYNEIILLNTVGTASMRVTKYFNNRKVAKLHQNVLVFYKGDIKKIKDNYNIIDPSLPVPEMKQNGLFDL